MNYKFYGIKQADQVVKTGKSRIKALISSVFQRVNSLQVFQRIKPKKYDKMYTYFVFVKNFTFAIILIAGVFVIVKAIRESQKRKWSLLMAPLYYLRIKTPPLIDQRAEALQAKVDMENEILIDMLLRQIFNREVPDEDSLDQMIPLEEHKNKFVIPSHGNEDSTHPCSCPPNDEEWAECSNGNISEIMYTNDVIDEDPTSIYQQNIKEYLSLIMHNDDSCTRHHKIKEKVMLQKKLAIFNKAYKDLCSNNLGHPLISHNMKRIGDEKLRSLFSRKIYPKMSMIKRQNSRRKKKLMSSSNPQSHQNEVNSQKNLNFFEIMSQLSNNYIEKH
ncbi:unnamed protein product [Moneuplotes crassus]|uniref:Uncharacterized protein n=1 Tax=Euplotes crassus TaxID=5936 RepID=A0AAD1XN00_EUPCR|nr:unnamed protein product [Moneuplotes crassus]